MSMCVSTAEARKVCATNFASSWSPRAFRLRRLAQSLCGELCLLLGRGIFPQNSRMKWLLWHVHVHFDAQARTQSGSPVLSWSLFGVLAWRSCSRPLQFLARRFSRDPSEMLSEAFAWSCAGPWETLLKRSWWNPLGVLTWSDMGHCEKLLWGSCGNPPQEVLALRCSALVRVWKFFWDAPRTFSYDDLVRSSL